MSFKNYSLHAVYLNSLFLLIPALSLISCNTAKRLTYLKDVKGNETVANNNSVQAPVYKIMPKDNLYVSIVSSNPEMNKLYNPSISSWQSTSPQQFEGRANQYINGFEVDESGNINLPLLKKINVGGLTIEEAEEKVRLASDEFLKDATVKVKLLSYKVTVMGEVKTPGVYNNYTRDFTVMDAISIANGTTDFAKLNNVLVLRPGVKISQTFQLNLNSKSSIYSEGFFLKPNDVVFVQPAKTKNLSQRSALVTIVFGSITSILLLLNVLK